MKSALRLGRTAGGLFLGGLAVLHAAGCAESEAENEPLEDLSPVLAQATGGPVVVPTEEQTITVKTKQVPVIGITSNSGSGCRLKLTAEPEALDFASLEIRFRDQYLIYFPLNSSKIYETKECIIRLKVTGAQGFRYAISRVGYVGQALLLAAQSRAIFDSRVWWSGRKPSTNNEKAKVITAPYTVNWDHAQSFRLESDRESTCFNSSDESDEVTIYTMLSLLNPGSTDPAQVRLDTALSDAMVEDPSAIEVYLEPRRCSP